MGSSSVTSGWWGVVVFSLFDLFGDGGSVTSVHAVRACLTTIEIPAAFRTRVVGGGATTTTATTTTTTTTY